MSMAAILAPAEARTKANDNPRPRAAPVITAVWCCSEKRAENDIAIGMNENQANSASDPTDNEGVFVD